MSAFERRVNIIFQWFNCKRRAGACRSGFWRCENFARRYIDCRFRTFTKSVFLGKKGCVICQKWLKTYVTSTQIHTHATMNTALKKKKKRRGPPHKWVEKCFKLSRFKWTAAYEQDVHIKKNKKKNNWHLGFSSPLTYNKMSKYLWIIIREETDHLKQLMLMYIVFQNMQILYLQICDNGECFFVFFSQVTLCSECRSAAQVKAGNLNTECYGARSCFPPIWVSGSKSSSWKSRSIRSSRCISKWRFVPCKCLTCGA